MCGLRYSSSNYCIHLVLHHTCNCKIIVHLTSDLYGMGVGEGVQAQCAGVLATEEVGPDVELWVGVVNTQVLYPGGETFVQPQVGPPLHGYLGNRGGKSHDGMCQIKR